MEAQKLFTGRKQHRHEGQVHFAEVTVRAEPCPGESQVVLSGEVLQSLREVFGPDFEHQRHCVFAAVSVQISTVNVAGEMPHAGATSFRAEVVGVEVSGNAGRQVSGFLLTVAGMRAIGDCLVAWENEQRGRSHGPIDEHPGWTETVESQESLITPLAGLSASDYARVVDRIEHLSEYDLLCAVYQTCYVCIRADIDDGQTEDEIRSRFVSTIESAGTRSNAVREALDDALTGRPMRYNPR